MLRPTKTSTASRSSRTPPRGAGGLMSWAASKAVGPWVQVSRVARLIS
jgi:hypothetical protein